LAVTVMPVTWNNQNNAEGKKGTFVKSVDFGGSSVTTGTIAEGVCVNVQYDIAAIQTTGYLQQSNPDKTKQIKVWLGHSDTNGDCTANVNAGVGAVVNVYCVAPDLAGAPAQERTPADCRGAGFEWVPATTTAPIIPAHCKYRYYMPSITGLSSDLPKKAAVCKAAGWVWNSPNCTCPAGKAGNYCS
jgi:hypothetical protein